MCGIAGFVGTSRLEPEAVQRCLSVMRRRGPDHADFRSWTTEAGRHVYLLNSRLSIIDLDDRSNQPLSVGRKWVTYNGEIYNYVELHAELERAGHVFRTQSDTEVLLAAFDRFGEGAWDKLEGMWAAAVFDEADGSLTLSRDRFGEKPLYIFEDESGLYFASEPKCIVALRGRALEVNPSQVRRFLVHGYKSLYKRGETFFRHLRELSPAHVLRIERDGCRRQHRYWQPVFQPDTGLAYEDAVAEVRTRLLRSVEIRLRADVPLAFCMSGGVDSNALIAIAKRVFGYDVHGFTIVDPDPRYNERDVLEPAIAELGIRHTVVPTNPSGFLDRLRGLVRYHDAPVVTIAYFAHAQLMEQIAAAGYKVAVSGTAADEIFSGYYDHHLAYLYEMRHDQAAYDRARADWAARIQPLVRNPHLGDPDLFIRDREFRGYITLGAERFAAALTTPWQEAFGEEHYVDDLLRNRMLNEMTTEVVPVILHEDDANAMFHSIENRSPYLDRSLVDYVLRVPTRHLVRHGLAKALLRDAVRGIAPAHVLDNPRKTGFNAPIESYLERQNPDVRAWLLGDSPIYDYVKREPIAELLDRPTLPNSDSKFLFAVVSSKIFLEQFAA